jgi:uncharacterized protein YbaR (Trm112 family)
MVRVIENLINDLVCPIGKYPLYLEHNFLICTNCTAKFPIIDDIPYLLIDDAVLPPEINSVNELNCFKEKESKNNG